MALSTGSNKIKTAIFISGTGSNLKSLIKFSKQKNSPIIIKMIISNNSKAKGLQYSKIYKIKKKIFHFKNALSEKKIINELKKDNIDLICLAGFMKILSKNFIKKFKKKILNIHPSLLPKYGGLMDLNVHDLILKNKEKFSGCTLHLVSEEVDKGRFILQGQCLVDKKDTVLTLKNFVEWGTVKGKTYIVTTTGHCQVVRDGWVIDQAGAKHVDEFHGKNKHINSIHEVGKLKHNFVIKLNIDFNFLY